MTTHSSHPANPPTPPLDPPFPRYCRRGFPVYRFIPGLAPHPTSDPRGHSYRAPGAPSPPHVSIAPEDWCACESYLYAADLYNHGYWWEAHEAWEEVWQGVDKGRTQGRFLQGLIQVAACHLKIHMGKRDGAIRLRSSSLEHLRFALRGETSERYMGIGLTDFVARADSYFAACVDAAPDAPRHQFDAYPWVLLASR